MQCANGFLFAMGVLIVAGGSVAQCRAAESLGFTQPVTVPPDVAQVTWDLRLPKDIPVVVNGVVSYDNAGTGRGGMLYPAPDFASFLVAVAVHGAIESAAKKKQKTHIQDEANQVLVPYKDVLESYHYGALIHDALAQMPFGTGKKAIEPGHKAGTDWVIDSAPSFLMTQDQRAFVLDDAITIYSPASASVPVYRNLVHVVSRPLTDDPASYWTVDQGANLRSEFARLYALSIDTALHAVAAGPKDNGSAFKTIRYRQGADEKIERAQVVDQQCDRMVVKTLRGEIISIPMDAASPTAVDIAACSPSQPVSVPDG